MKTSMLQGHLFFLNPNLQTLSTKLNYLRFFWIKSQGKSSMQNIFKCAKKMLTSPYKFLDIRCINMLSLSLLFMQIQRTCPSEKRVVCCLHSLFHSFMLKVNKWMSCYLYLEWIGCYDYSKKSCIIIKTTHQLLCVAAHEKSICEWVALHSRPFQSQRVDEPVLVQQILHRGM